ncbi:MAG: Pr6Pr family membrane protein [Proteobacteria bacterium]|nr:Pr6Pr family membrane protein [Pseudomonadota bacterium]
MNARIAAAIVAALAWMALLLQLFLSLRLSMANGNGIVHGVWMYLAYFTVLTNLLVAVVATNAARRPDGGRDLRWRGGAVSAIVLVGLGYFLLLRGLADPEGLDWLSNLLLHYIVPLAALAWWLALPPRRHIAATEPWRWLQWPLLYAVYALIRGAITGFYPYPFIDVPALGITRTLIHCAGLGVAFLAIAWLLRALTRLRA